MSHRGRGRRLKYSDYKPPNVELFREHDAARRYYERRGMAFPAKSVPDSHPVKSIPDSLPVSVPDSSGQFANRSSAFAARFARLPEIIPNDSSSTARASCSLNAATSDGFSSKEAGRENASSSQFVTGGQPSVQTVYPSTWNEPKDIEDITGRNSESDSVSDPSNGDSGIEDPSVKPADDDVGQEEEKIQQPSKSTIPPFRRLGELRSLMGMPQSLYQEDPQKKIIEEMKKTIQEDVDLHDPTPSEENLADMMQRISLSMINRSIEEEDKRLQAMIRLEMNSKR